MARDRSRDQPWTLGRWLAKAGREGEFKSAWQAFAQWTVQHIPESAWAYLLQDAQEPRLFYSFGPWANTEAIAGWRARPEFQAFLAKARELCDEVEPHMLREAAQAGHPS